MKHPSFLLLVAILFTLGLTAAPPAQAAGCGFECRFALGCSSANPDQWCGGSGSNCWEWFCYAATASSEEGMERFEALQALFARLEEQGADWDEIVETVAALDEPIRVVEVDDPSREHEFANEAYVRHKNRPAPAQDLACSQLRLAAAETRHER